MYEVKKIYVVIKKAMVYVLLALLLGSLYFIN